MPRLVQNLMVPSDTVEFNARVRVLFREKIVRVMEGELVRKLERKLEDVCREIGRLELLLKKANRLVVCRELLNKKDGNVREKELIEKRIKEFRSAMECLLEYIDGKVFDSCDVKVLMLKGTFVFLCFVYGSENVLTLHYVFEGTFNWNKIFWMIKRECRRLEDGLPIYADRKDILSQIHCQQVVCLILTLCALRRFKFARVVLFCVMNDYLIDA